MTDEDVYRSLTASPDSAAAVERLRAQMVEGDATGVREAVTDPRSYLGKHIRATRRSGHVVEGKAIAYTDRPVLEVEDSAGRRQMVIIDGAEIVVTPEPVAVNDQRSTTDQLRNAVDLTPWDEATYRERDRHRDAILAKIKDECPTFEVDFEAEPGDAVGVPDAAITAANYIMEALGRVKPADAKSVGRCGSRVSAQLDSLTGTFTCELLHGHAGMHEQAQTNAPSVYWSREVGTEAKS